MSGSFRFGLMRFIRTWTIWIGLRRQCSSHWTSVAIKVADYTGINLYRLFDVRR
ncbi:hypothetical protein [Candidatus Hodgkinia cicadicola]|uniref:hypothetical protein n=1 Tax=Candidatus Hodgkinia cicadicola TaxID=573658 RepID=UPI001788C37C